MDNLTKSRWVFKKLSHDLYFSMASYSILAILPIVIASQVNIPFPEMLTVHIDEQVTTQVLQILATTMLTITAFSLTTMVSAHNSVISRTSPRVSALILNNRVTLNAISTFTGSFLFGLIGLMSIHTGLYSDAGYVLLFIVSIFIVVIIVVSLLNWIHYLIHLGRNETIASTVESITTQVLSHYQGCPCFGYNMLTKSILTKTEGYIDVIPNSIGYVQHINFSVLEKYVDNNNIKIYVTALPGHFVNPHTPLVKISQKLCESTCDKIRDAFTIDRERTFDFDPRFCFVVMSEISSKALSQGINDPGTAIDIVNRATRLLLDFVATPNTNNSDVKNINIWVNPLKEKDLLEDFFLPIARDASDCIEVHAWLQHALKTLFLSCDENMSEAIREISDKCFMYAKCAISIEHDIEKLIRIRDY